MEYAWIEYEHIWDADKQEIGHLIRWVGESKLARMSPSYQASINQERLKIGDLDLRVIDRDGVYLVVTPDTWYAPIYKAIHRLIRTGEVCKYFVIYALSVWGLANISPGAIPSWRDIKWPKRQ